MVLIVSCAFLDFPGPLAFAHRGGAAHGPENSWPAFEHAVGLGYSFLETDARATADGVLLAFHDRTLDRLAGRPGEIARLPHREIAAARIGGAEPIPLLEDLIGAWPDVRFNVDVKDAGAIRPLADVLRRTAAWDRVCICSFSARRLRGARRALGRPVCSAASPAGIAAVRLGARARSPAQCAQVPAPVAGAPFIRRAHALGLQVHAWTVNDRALMESLLELGVDGIITDQTVTLREVLTARGQWHPRQPG
jgi:glycerophosphoryl diester phosphodiesterase